MHAFILHHYANSPFSEKVEAPRQPEDARGVIEIFSTTGMHDAVADLGRVIATTARNRELSQRILTPRQAELYALMPVKAAPDTSKFLLSPMPGLLREVSVKVGQDVKAGEKLAVIEAMKMENILKAEQDCKVKSIVAASGASLAVDEVIIEFE